MRIFHEVTLSVCCLLSHHNDFLNEIGRGIHYFILSFASVFITVQSICHFLEFYVPSDFAFNF